MKTPSNTNKRTPFPALRRIVGLGMFLVLFFTVSCTQNLSLPTEFTQTDSLPKIYPDYIDVTVPQNIAPLTFRMEEEGMDIVARLSVGEQEWIVGNPDGVCPSPEQWEEMKQAALNAKDGAIKVEVFAKANAECRMQNAESADNTRGEANNSAFRIQNSALTEGWTKYRPFSIFVSSDSIDPYIAYRLISPSYVTYEGLTINQRCLETYDEKVVYSNMINTTEKDGQCINCHHFQAYNPERFQFHCRQHLGGTMIAQDGKVEKHAISAILQIDDAGDTIRSGGVYPAWHPTEPLIAYSTNKTGQTFYTYDRQKVEVQDTYSDLILYDINNRKIIPLEKDTNDLDCFPAWSPDGRYLYYCSAHYEKQDTLPETTKEMDLIKNYRDVHYNLYRRSFDLQTLSFGPRELVYDCGDSLSATLPRISPDGRHLLFTVGQYGIFHIWHNSSDLYMMDLDLNAECRMQNAELEDGMKGEANNSALYKVRRLDEVNSPDVESYHSWSSNGRWIIFSSRRHDGNFTRPFMAHLNPDGTFSRPFELPQANPSHHLLLMRSYNIPEFMHGPITISPQELARVVRGDN